MPEWGGRLEASPGTLVLRKEAPPGIVPAPGTGSGNAVAIALTLLAFLAILVLTSVVVIVILLTMGNQIQNVFSNVAQALSS